MRRRKIIKKLSSLLLSILILISCVPTTVFAGIWNIYYDSGSGKWMYGESGDEQEIALGDYLEGFYEFTGELYIDKETTCVSEQVIEGTAVKIDGNKLYVCTNHDTITPTNGLCATCGRDSSGNLHAHNWVYSADGATLKAYCNADGCTSGATSEATAVSLTLSATSQTYSGSAYSGAIIKDSSNNLITDTTNNLWIKAGIDAPTIKYVGRDDTTYAESTTAPTAVGKYKVSMTAGISPNTKTASADFEITKAAQEAPASGVGYTLNYIAETLISSTDYEVSSSNTSVVPLTNNKVTPSTTYYVRKKGDDNHEPSNWTSISVPARPSAPTGYTAVDTTTASGTDGKITGVTTALEYSTDNGSNWNGVTGTEITGLSAGTVLLRVKATASAFASSTVEVTISDPCAHTSSNKIDGQAATCTADGWSDYYQCSNTSCNKYFKELACTTEITDLEVWKTTDGQGRIAKLGHDWGYTANGATLTASCNRKTVCGQSDVTLTLSATSPTYSGSPVEAILTDTDGKWASNVNSTLPTITYYTNEECTVKTTVGSAGDTTSGATTEGGAPKNIGKYWAAITVGIGNDAKTAKIAFSINNEIQKINLTSYPSMYRNINEIIQIVKNDGTLADKSNIKIKDEDEDKYVISDMRLYGTSYIMLIVSPKEGYAFTETTDISDYTHMIFLTKDENGEPIEGTKHNVLKTTDDIASARTFIGNDSYPVNIGDIILALPVEEYKIPIDTITITSKPLYYKNNNGTIVIVNLDGTEASISDVKIKTDDSSKYNAIDMRTKGTQVSLLIRPIGEYVFLDTTLYSGVTGRITFNNGTKQVMTSAILPALKSFYSDDNYPAKSGDMILTWNLTEFVPNHVWEFTATNNKLIAKCKGNGNGCTFDTCNYCTDENAVTLVLTATSPTYSGSVEGLDAFNTATGLSVAADSNYVKFYKTETEGATTGGTLVSETTNPERGYYYAELTVEGATAVKAFTVNYVAVAATSISLDGTIGINYYLDIPDDMITAGDKKVVMTFDGTGRSQEVAITQEALASYKITAESAYNGYYKFTFPVAAKEINKEVTLKIVDDSNNCVKLVKKSDGSAYANNTFSYSVMKYIDRVTSDVNYDSYNNLKALLNALKDYGNSARIFFDYDATGASITGNLSAVEIGDTYKGEETGSVTGISFSERSLIVESETSIKVKFNITSGTVEDYEFTVNGVAVTPNQENGTYYVTKDNIAAKDLSTKYIFTVKNKTTGATSTLSYSGLSYGYAVLHSEGQSDNLKNVVKAMKIYNEKAKAYFEDPTH